MVRFSGKVGVLWVATIAVLAAPSGPARAGTEKRVAASGRGAHGSFSPSAVRARVGETVRWTAAEGDHTVVADGGAFHSDAFAADYEPHDFSYTFTEPGRYTYHCSLAQMTGVIEVSGQG